MNGQFAGLDRIDGDIDALSTRLARVRTLAYVANRADWLADPPSWQGRARALEDRLSDTLHQSLMQRFVDRRTSALLRSLSERAGPILGGIDADGRGDGRGPFRRPARRLSFRARARGDGARESRAARARSSGSSRPRLRGGSARWRARATRLSRSGPAAACDWRGEPAGELAGGDAVLRHGCALSANSEPSRSASAPPGGSRRSPPLKRAGGSPLSSI